MVYNDDYNTATSTILTASQDGVIWRRISELTRAVGETMMTTTELIGELIVNAWHGNPFDSAEPLLKKRLRWRQYQMNFIDQHQPEPLRIPNKQIRIRNHLFFRRMMPHNPRDKKEKLLCSSS